MWLRFFHMYPLGPLVLGAEDNLCLFSSELWQDWGSVPDEHGEYGLEPGTLESCITIFFANEADLPVQAFSRSRSK